MGGTSFLAWRGEVGCRCVRHLYAPWRRHATRRLFATLLVRCRHRRSAVGVLSILMTRRVWFHRRRSTKVLFPGIALSRYPDTMKKGFSVLPRDPDVLCPEIAPSVQQLLPDTSVPSVGLPGEMSIVNSEVGGSLASPLTSNATSPDSLLLCAIPASEIAPPDYPCLPRSVGQLHLRRGRARRPCVGAVPTRTPLSRFHLQPHVGHPTEYTIQHRT